MCAKSFLEWACPTLILSILLSGCFNEVDSNIGPGGDVDTMTTSMAEGRCTPRGGSCPEALPCCAGSSCESGTCQDPDGDARNPYLDLDVDGYPPGEGDCNDDDPDIGPQAMEICGACWKC